MAQQTIAPWAEAVNDAGFPMSAEELACLPDDGFQHELVEGRLVRMPTPKPLHGLIAARITRLVSTHVEEYGLGTVFTGDAGFLLSGPAEPDTVLGADVSFVRAGRLPPADSPEWNAYLRLAPDLAVEVASPSQFRPEMTAKARQWLAAGTRLVWLVWPSEQTVDVWRPGCDTSREATVKAPHVGDLLTGDDVVPGFTLSVTELFIAR